MQGYGSAVGVVSWGPGTPAPVAGTGPAVHVAGPADGTPAAGATVVAVTEALARAAAVNRGVVALPREAGWVLAVDTGVTLAPGALDALLAAAVRFPRAAALGPRMPGPVAGALPARRDLLAGRVPLGAPRSAGPVGWVGGRCVLLRRAAWDSVDGYDPRHLGPVDAVDLGDRLARAGWTVVHVPGAEAGVAPGPVPGMLETARDGLRRYAADRHRGLARLT